MANNDYRYDQICELRRCCSADSKLSAKDIGFGSSLCDQYFSRLSLSEKQWYWVGKLLENAGAKPAGSSSAAESSSREETFQEIFDGTKIKALFAAAATYLKYPRLRYQTDGSSKVVFSYAADTGSNWAGCTFIDNGSKEGKKRYGFVDRLGNGRINRDATPEVKALIKSVASDPTKVAKLQGQKYTYCCFCGLELTNKSSVYHGYGPICAENWGLTWGETGDIKDEEEAAKKELAQVNLVELN